MASKIFFWFLNIVSGVVFMPSVTVEAATVFDGMTDYFVNDVFVFCTNVVMIGSVLSSLCFRGLGASLVCPFVGLSILCQY